MSLHERVWIGLVETRGSAPGGPIDGAKGAYAYVLAWVRDAAGFRTAAEKVLASRGLRVAETEDVEPLAEYRKREEVTEEVLREAVDVADGRGAVVLSFHTWTDED